MVRCVKRESFEVRRKGRGYWSDRYAFHDDIPLLTGPVKLLCLFARARVRCRFRRFRNYHPACIRRRVTVFGLRKWRPSASGPPGSYRVLPSFKEKGTEREGELMAGEEQRNLHHLITLVGRALYLGTE